MYWNIQEKIIREYWLCICIIRKLSTVFYREHLSVVKHNDTIQESIKHRHAKCASFKRPEICPVYTTRFNIW